MRYQTNDDDSSHFTIACDLCESDFATEQPNAYGLLTDNMPEGALVVGEWPHAKHVCPACRYFGSPDMHEVIRALRALRLSVSQAKANVSDNGYRIARITPAGEYSRGEKEHALNYQTNAYNALGSIESSINLLATSLEDKEQLSNLRHESLQESKTTGDI